MCDDGGGGACPCGTDDYDCCPSGYVTDPYDCGQCVSSTGANPSPSSTASSGEIIGGIVFGIVATCATIIWCMYTVQKNNNTAIVQAQLAQQQAQPQTQVQVQPQPQQQQPDSLHGYQPPCGGVIYVGA